MTDPHPCRIIGVLDDGLASLGERARAALASADIVFGARRTLTLLDRAMRPGAECVDIVALGLAALPERIRRARDGGRAVVVLATGDPLCHGIAGTLAAQLCVQALEILPNVSTLQLACARVGLPWADARIVSVHGADHGEWAVGTPPGHGLYPLAQALRAHDRLLVLTSPANTPARIARLLKAEGQAEDWLFAVAECLGRPEERVRSELSAQQVTSLRFDDPNVVLLWRQRPAPRPPRFGLPDAAYARRKPGAGLITKREVRAVSLAQLQLRCDSRVWDLGAGSGSVGLEAARLCPQGHVWAIEKNAEDAAIARHNRAAMGVSNHTLVHGRAPEGLAAWPDPDAVFIGGSGGELATLITLALQRLRADGRLVINLVTLENLAQARATLDAAGPDVHHELLQLQAARSQSVRGAGHLTRLAAENPVWILTAWRESSASAAAADTFPATLADAPDWQDDAHA